MNFLQILELFAAVSAIISVYFYGNKVWYAPLIGFASQVIWITWCVAMDLYSMFILCCGMVLVHYRNMIKFETMIKLKLLLLKHKL